MKVKRKNNRKNKTNLIGGYYLSNSKSLMTIAHFDV